LSRAFFDDGFVENLAPIKADDAKNVMAMTAEEVSVTANLKDLMSHYFVNNR
jgi:hypothetical protein